MLTDLIDGVSLVIFKIFVGDKFNAEKRAQAAVSESCE
jgi:hypothetical protein